MAAVAEWATPTTCTDVPYFVGLAKYNRKFVRRFSGLAAPLTALCSPPPRLAWGGAEQQSFDLLKTTLTSAHVLRVWDLARPKRLLTDSSELAVSAILEQPYDAGDFHPVAFESRNLPGRKLTQLERSYPPHMLELLEMMHVLKALCPYFLDKPFELHTNSSSYVPTSSTSPSSCTPILLLMILLLMKAFLIFSGQILKKIIITLQAMRFKLNCLNQTCISSK